MSITFEKTTNLYEKNGLPTIFFEFNESKSRIGTIRGLHFQQKHSQGKLIRVVKGAVFDVAVDLRLNSKTFGKWEGFILSEDNHNTLFIPKGFAHGFLALKDDTVFSYKCTDIYDPIHDSGIRFDDPEIGIDWPVDMIGGWSNVITSEKDMRLQSLKNFKESNINIE